MDGVPTMMPMQQVLCLGWIAGFYQARKTLWIMQNMSSLGLPKKKKIYLLSPDPRCPIKIKYTRPRTIGREKRGKRNNKRLKKCPRIFITFMLRKKKKSYDILYLRFALSTLVGILLV